MKKMNNMVILESVGCVLIDGIVYPQLENGSPDFECGVTIDDLDSDFINQCKEEIIWK